MQRGRAYLGSELSDKDVLVVGIVPLCDVGLEVGGRHVVPVDTDIVELSTTASALTKHGRCISTMLRNRKTSVLIGMVCGVHATARRLNASKTQTHRASAIAGIDPVLDPGEAVGVRARRRGAIHPTIRLHS